MTHPWGHETSMDMLKGPANEVPSQSKGKGCSLFLTMKHIEIV